MMHTMVSMNRIEISRNLLKYPGMFFQYSVLGKLLW